MNRMSKGVWIAAALASGLALFCMSAMAGDEENEVTLTGILIEADWDDDGDLIAVDLETDDETISIANEGIGEELLAHVGSRVEIVGTLSEYDDGWKVVVVSSYTVLPEDGT